VHELSFHALSRSIENDAARLIATAPFTISTQRPRLKLTPRRNPADHQYWRRLHCPDLRRTEARPMSPDPSNSSNSFDQRLQEAARRAEEELRRFVRYLDDEVVPEVRRNSSSALRTAALHLQKLADNMDDARAKAGKGSSGTDTSSSHS
jgi:hypothetical protein